MSARSVVAGIVAVFVTVLSSLSASPDLAAADSHRVAVSAFYICNGEAATIVGTPGDDVLVGTNAHDVIVGRGGDDIIYGNGGDDLVCGGGGDDTLRGGRGDDWLAGGSGFDTLIGGAGDDAGFDERADCRTESKVGCAPAIPANLPVCGNAPEFVVHAIHLSFHDTPHVCYFASHIAYRESRWTPTAIGGPNRNGTYDYGLLQLNSGYIRTWAEWAGVDWNDWDDPIINAQMARALYDRAGEMWGDPLRPWAVRR